MKILIMSTFNWNNNGLSMCDCQCATGLHRGTPLTFELLDSNSLICLVWLFAINRTTIPRIYSCSELVCAIVDLGIVGLSVMCAQCGHNLFIYLCKT